MARPIKATPKLNRQESDRLLRDLEKTCSPAEARRRVVFAREKLRQMKMVKPFADENAATP